MKRLILIVTVIFTGATSCKTKKQTAATPKGDHTGYVSQQYKSEGCGSVIVMVNEADTTILIPKDPLGKFDRDGLILHFNYQPLRMPNPPGCNRGMMAEIIDISAD